MGLARAAQHALGRAGLRAGRGAVALRALSRRALRADDLRAPRRRAARDPRRPGRHAAGLARRPDGDGGDRGQRPAGPAVRAAREALRVDVAICPPHRPQRKGVVEAAIRYLGGRWWRTAQAGSLGEAQASLDAFCARVSDARRRRGSTVGELGAAEPLGPLPATPYPARIMVARKASRSALVAFDGNRYSVPPAYAGRTVIGDRRSR